MTTKKKPGTSAVDDAAAPQENTPLLDIATAQANHIRTGGALSELGWPVNDTSKEEIVDYRLLIRNHNIPEVVLKHFFRDEDYMRKAYDGTLSLPFADYGGVFPIAHEWKELLWRLSMREAWAEDQVLEAALAGFIQGFKAGYDSFFTQHIDPAVLVYSDPAIIPQMVYDYAVARNILSDLVQDSIKQLTILKTSYEGAQQLKTPAGWDHAGRQQGYIYRAWVAILQTPHKYGPIAEAWEKRKKEREERVEAALFNLEVERLKENGFGEEAAKERAKESQSWYSRNHSAPSPVPDKAPPSRLFADVQGTPAPAERTIGIRLDVIKPLHELLKQHFPLEDHTRLLDALNGVSLDRPIFWSEQRNLLIEIFHRLEYNGAISGQTIKLIKWLQDTFIVSRKGDPSMTEQLKEDTIKDVFYKGGFTVARKRLLKGSGEPWLAYKQSEYKPTTKSNGNNEHGE